VAGDEAARRSREGRRFDWTNRYRTRWTAVILEDAECCLWDLCELDAAAEAGSLSPEMAEQGRALLRLTLAEAHDELARRQWLRDRPRAPAWPGRAAAPRDERGCPRRADLDWLKAAADLPSIIERVARVELRRVGKEWLGRCPFPDHPDATPSFRVNQEKGVFYCHGCRRGGDVLTALMQFGGFEHFIDAAAWLADDVGGRG
jgi:hypothetical protein